MDIGPGDFVECVDASDPHPTVDYGQRLQVGRLYCVRWVEIRNSAIMGVNTPSIGVDDLTACWVAAGGAAGGWDLRRFQPTYRRKAELIEGLLTPIDAEPVPA